jgi:hypothetical protein
MKTCLIAVVLFAGASASSAAPQASGTATKPAAQAPATAPAAKPADRPPAPEGQALPGTPVDLSGREQVDPSVPSKYRDEVASAQVEGAKLQQEDFAVWAASNTLVQSGLRAPGTATGWLATPKDPLARTWTVSFTGKNKDNKAIIYADVDVDLSKPPPKISFRPAGAGRIPTADETALIHARDAVSTAKDWLRCADDYNYSSSMREGKKGRETVIRALPARHRQDLYLLGGFHEFTAPATSSKSKVKMKQFHQTNTCIELTLPKHGTGFVVSHLRSDTPTFFHVFANLSYERPVYVKIDSRTWKVDGGRITVLDKDSVKSLKTEAPPPN